MATDSGTTAGYLLSRNELEALEEIGKPMHAGRPYWWRQASMRKLEVRGLVRRCSGRETSKIAGWEITESGRYHLSGFPVEAESNAE